MQRSSLPNQTYRMSSHLKLSSLLFLFFSSPYHSVQAAGILDVEDLIRQESDGLSERRIYDGEEEEAQSILDGISFQQGSHAGVMLSRKESIKRSMKRKQSAAKSEAVNRHDLSKWKYADLRGTLNTWVGAQRGAEWWRGKATTASSVS